MSPTNTDDVSDVKWCIAGVTLRGELMDDLDEANINDIVHQYYVIIQ